MAELHPADTKNRDVPVKRRRSAQTPTDQQQKRSSAFDLTHCTHRGFGMEMMSYYTCSYTLACNRFKMDAENLKTKFHGA